LVEIDIQRNDECPPLPTTTAPETTESVTTSATTEETTESVTTSATTESCQCPCSGANMTDEVLQEKIAELKRTLTVDVKTTSQYERKFISVDDPRPSAKSIGIVFGPILISVILGLIVLADISRLFGSVSRCKKSIGNLRSECKSKNKYKNRTILQDEKNSTEGKPTAQKDGKEITDSQKSKLNEESQQNYNPNQTKLNNLKQTKWNSNSALYHRHKHYDQSEGINGPNKHFRDNLKNSQIKQDANSGFRNCEKPSNLPA
jgi:Sec-independent protein translocase protein TatA